MGFYLTFGVEFLSAIPQITDPIARKCIALFGAGLLGGVTLSSKNWADDMEEVVYKDPNLAPHFFDFFGYLSMFIEAGITGCILIALVNSGLIILTGKIDIETNSLASYLLAYCGGLFHFAIIDKLKKFINSIVKN